MAVSISRDTPNVTQIKYLHQWSSRECVKIHIESQNSQGDCRDVAQFLLEQLDNQKQQAQLEAPLHTDNTLGTGELV